MLRTILLVISVLSSSLILNSQDRWVISPDGGIKCNVDIAKLPYADNIEMTGRKVAGIIHYAVDTAQQLTIEREIIFPQLRKHIKDTDQIWAKYRAYLKDTYEDDILPKVYVADKIFVPGKLQEIEINGELDFTHAPSKSGLSLKRIFFPHVTGPLFYELWTLKNETEKALPLKIAGGSRKQVDYGVYGKYERIVKSTIKWGGEDLRPGESIDIVIQIHAIAEGDTEYWTTANEFLEKRRQLISEFDGKFILETPEPVLNTLFRFSKIRAAENIFDSKMGIVHSPGGGRYYTGVWANDQAEYSGPFFPYLGYADGNLAALNAYKKFYEQMKTIPNYDKNLWASYEMNGEETCCGTDRGDAAMIAYGGAHYLLALGDEKIATDYWPMIAWALEYSHRKLNSAGVVMSESDEMEGRIPTGTANLATSSMYYGALLLAADLSKALGQSKAKSKKYLERAAELRINIESYFGATVEGLQTYKYFDTHKYLRHWICLPLVMGIDERKEGTISALFDRLWTDNGVHVEKNSANEAISKIFWDRGTLYALRGTFIAGETERSLEKLLQFSKKRLLGDRVPYVVEAFPEGNMAHLSAESALYCRVISEGMFGLNPTGLRSFTLQPRLPVGWDKMALRRVAAFGQLFDIEVKRTGEKLTVIVKNQGKLLEHSIDSGDKVSFQF